MNPAFVMVVVVVVIALLFDFVNGFHDAANAIATIVISKPSLHCRPCFWPGSQISSGTLFSAPPWPK